MSIWQTNDHHHLCFRQQHQDQNQDQQQKHLSTVQFSGGVNSFSWLPHQSDSAAAAVIGVKPPTDTKQRCLTHFSPASTKAAASSVQFRQCSLFLLSRSQYPLLRNCGTQWANCAKLPPPITAVHTHTGIAQTDSFCWWLVVLR